MTYGGPFDSYTLSERNDFDSDKNHIYFTRERYDHDENTWVLGEEELNCVLMDSDKVLGLETLAQETKRNRSKKNLEKIRKESIDIGFIRGIALAAGFINEQGDSTSAKGLLKACGIKNKKELIDAEVDKFDLDKIGDILPD